MTEAYQKKAVSVVVSHGLTPPEAEAVRLYTDPLSPTYGKKKLSSDRAGASYAMWQVERVARALESIERDRSERGEHVSTYLGHNAADAAMELVQQLSSGRDLEVRDPQEIFDAIVEGVGRRVHLAVQDVDGMDEDTVLEIVQEALGACMKEQRMLLGEINSSNRTALMAVKERRAAVELILAYHMGTPQQKVKLESEKPQAEENSLDLGLLDDEDLEKLRQAIDEVAGMRKG